MTMTSDITHGLSAVKNEPEWPFFSTGSDRNKAGNQVGPITKLLRMNGGNPATAGAQAGHVTVLLQAWNRDNDENAFKDLVNLVYKELKKIAHGLVRKESKSPFQATELIGEAYEALAKKQVIDFQNRKHFFRIAALAMRRVLIHEARKNNAVKRNAGAETDTLQESLISAPERANLIRLDDALNDLEKLDGVYARVVELKFFGGYTTKEIAEILDMSDTAVKRHWAFSKSWMYQRVKK